MQLLPISPLHQKLGALCMLFAGIAIALAIRMRCSRDRRRIREDLLKRRCRMVSAHMIAGHSRFFGAATYDVEFRDVEDDPGQGTCTAKRGIITWSEQLFDLAPKMAEALPEYGQNWRG